jgi:hypothetical protein
MPEPTPQCLICERTDDAVPLLTLTYQGKSYWVCPQHLPVLIHKPHQVAHIFPGMDTEEGPSGHSH